MGAYLHKFNLLPQIASRQDKQIATLQASMKIVIKAVDTLAQDHPGLVSLALDEQLSNGIAPLGLFGHYSTINCQSTISAMIN
jgi:hypothetical protein